MWMWLYWAASRLACLALPSPILPCPALPSPSLPYPALPYPALPYPALPYPALPCPALPCPTIPYPDFYWPPTHMTLCITALASSITLQFTLLSPKSMPQCHTRAHPSSPLNIVLILTLTVSPPRRTVWFSFFSIVTTPTRLEKRTCWRKNKPDNIRGVEITEKVKYRWEDDRVLLVVLINTWSSVLSHHTLCFYSSQ